MGSGGMEEPALNFWSPTLGTTEPCSVSWSRG